MRHFKEILEDELDNNYFNPNVNIPINYLDRIIKKEPIIVDKKINRNDLCSCGSGKKYKKCCL